MAQTTLLVETTDHLKPRILALVTVGIIIAFGLFVTLGTEQQIRLSAVAEAFQGGSVTPLTLLMTGFASGLFFLPVPAELAYVYGLRQGTDPLLSMIAVIGGFVTGHVISYLVGLKLSRFVRYFISPKKLYGARRKVNRWGGYAILGFNLLPAPGPQLTFGLGIARYNFARLMSLVVIGNTVKYAAITGFVLLA